MSRWVQMPVEDAKQLACEKSDSITLGSGYAYTDKGISMVKYHVDALHMHDIEIYIKTPYGGNASVRKPSEKSMLVSFGHDEAIFHQNSFSSRSWGGPEGQSVIHPKSEGQGLMISALQSREFGFGFQPLLSPQWAIINEKRNGEKYVDEDAAISIHGTAFKKVLEKDPFVM